MIAIADSSGQITEAYAGSGHDQSSWQGAGLTTQAQTFDPRKWQTDDTWGGIQQFRNRAYDPATGTWIQEDPMGVAGGVNVYRFNNGNPVSFGDPFGLCPPDDLSLLDCDPGVITALFSSAGGAAGGAIGAVAGGAGCLATVVGTVVCAAGGAVAGAGAGAKAGAIVGSAVDIGFQVGKALFGDEQRVLGEALDRAGGKSSNTRGNRREFGDFVEELKKVGEVGTKNSRGDFTFRELVDKAKLFLRID